MCNAPYHAGTIPNDFSSTVWKKLILPFIPSTFCKQQASEEQVWQECRFTGTAEATGKWGTGMTRVSLHGHYRSNRQVRNRYDKSVTSRALQKQQASEEQVWQECHFMGTTEATGKWGTGMTRVSLHGHYRSSGKETQKRWLFRRLQKCRSWDCADMLSCSSSPFQTWEGPGKDYGATATRKALSLTVDNHGQPTIIYDNAEQRWHWGL